MRPSTRWHGGTSNYAGARPALGALVAALFFGASAPAAKRMLADVDAALLAAILYLGSGVVLALLDRARAARDEATAADWRRDGIWLAGSVLAGGVAAPLLLVWGLERTSASSASLMLALEAPLTAVFARALFAEHVGVRATQALVLMSAALLAIAPHDFRGAETLGLLAVLAASACWGLDNNFMREITGLDAVRIAAVKGLVGGSVNGTAALWLGANIPPMSAVLGAGLIGAVGYGLSLVLYVRALRELGAARTAAYFAAAPIFGVAGAVVLLGEPGSWRLGLACGLVLAGTWRLVAERHAHWHRHEALEHVHVHVHDEHHLHEHAPGTERDPHEHRHRHEPLEHEHPHVPDVHHRHGH